MSSTFPGSQLLDGFLHIGHVRLGEKWVSGLGDLKRDAVFPVLWAYMEMKFPAENLQGILYMK